MTRDDLLHAILAALAAITAARMSGVPLLLALLLGAAGALIVTAVPASEEDGR